MHRCYFDGYLVEYRELWRPNGVLRGWTCSCETYARTLHCEHTSRMAQRVRYGQGESAVTSAMTDYPQLF